MRNCRSLLFVLVEKVSVFLSIFKYDYRFSCCYKPGIPYRVGAFAR